MGKVIVIDHPLIQHKLSLIRDKNTGAKEFRELVEEVSMLMAYEVTRDLTLQDTEIETPICKTMTKTLSGKKMGLIPILRAGLGMVDGMMKLIPAAKIGHIGVYRDPETLQPRGLLLQAARDIAERDLIIVDPMRPGGSACAAIDFLKTGVQSPSAL